MIHSRKLQRLVYRQVTSGDGALPKYYYLDFILELNLEYLLILKLNLDVFRICDRNTTLLQNFAEA